MKICRQCGKELTKLWSTDICLECSKQNVRKIFEEHPDIKEAHYCPECDKILDITEIDSCMKTPNEIIDYCLKCGGQVIDLKEYFDGE